MRQMVETKATPPEQRGIRSVIRNTVWGSLQSDRDYRWFWSAHTASVYGSQITSVALPLVAVITLNASSEQMGLLRAVQVLPALLFGLVAGVLVDQMRKRPLLVGADLGRAGLLALIPLASAIGILHLEVIYIVAFLTGTLSVLFDITRFSVLPTIVKREQIAEGNAKLEASWSSASIVGPGIGGLLVQLLTAPIAILVDAFSFLVSAFFLQHLPSESAPQPKTEERKRITSEIADGLRFVGRNAFLRPIAVSMSLFLIGMGAFGSVYILYLSRELELSPTAIGIVLAFSGPGFLLGALITNWVPEKFGLGRTLIISQAMGGIAFTGIALVSGPKALVIAVICAFNLINGVFAQVSAVNQLTLRHHITPRNLMGRTNATMRFISWAGAPLAAIGGGVLGQQVGLHWALIFGGGTMLVAVIPLIYSPIRTLRSYDELSPEPA
jgi:MFS family permease